MITITSLLLRFTDLSPPSDDVVYLVAVIASHSCDDGIITGRQNQVHTSSVLNKIGMLNDVTGVPDHEKGSKRT